MSRLLVAAFLSLLINTNMALADEQAITVESTNGADSFTLKFNNTVFNAMQSSFTSAVAGSVHTWTGNQLEIEGVKFDFRLFAMESPEWVDAMAKLPDFKISSVPEGTKVGALASDPVNMSWDLEIVSEELLPEFYKGKRTLTSTFSFNSISFRAAPDSPAHEKYAKYYYSVNCSKPEADGSKFELFSSVVVAPSEELRKNQIVSHNVNVVFYDLDFAKCEGKGGVSLNFHSVTTGIMLYSLKEVRWSITQIQ